MSKFLAYAVVAAFAFAGRPSVALPIVSISPPSSTVPLGGTLVIDVEISGVEPSSPLNAFSLDVFYDPTVLDAVAVVDGGFLVAPVIVVQETFGAMSVEFAETTVGPGGASGSGTLAVITFATVALGSSVLDLDDVALSAPFGVPIPTEAIEDGSATVVPEPETLALAAAGLTGLGLRARRRRLAVAIT